MTNKKLFKSALIITAVMLSVSGCAGGCSKQTDPVIADATVETPEPEESVESIESAEPTPQCHLVKASAVTLFTEQGI